MPKSRPSVDQLTRALELLEKSLRAATAERPRQPSLAEAWAIAHMVRAADSLKALRAVSGLNLPHETGPLARVICEAGIQLAWLAKSDGTPNTTDTVEARAQELLDAAKLVAERNARMWAKQDFCSPADARELTDRLDSIRKRRKKQGLRPVTEPALVNMATSAGPDIAEAYDLWYRTLCDSAHASVWASAEAADPKTERAEEVHSRTLFIAFGCALMVFNFGQQLRGRATAEGTLTNQLSDILGIPVGGAPAGT